MANKKFQGFDATDEDELWKRYAKTQNQDIRDYFVVKYAPLVKYVAGKIAMECQAR